MNALSNLASGRGTYALGWALLAWVMAAALPDTLVQLPPPDETAIGGFLGAMGVTLRRAIGKTKPTGSP